MAEQPPTQPIDTRETVKEKLAQEASQRRRKITSSFWPRGVLLFFILKDRFDSEETLEQASALTYKTLFSLIPVFVLALLVLGAISSGSKLDEIVQTKIFEQLQLDKVPMLDKDGNPSVDDKGNHLMLADSVKPMIAKAKATVTAKTTVAGLIALGILLYGAISLMIVVEGAFNQIYGQVKGRSWSRRILLYWCVLTLGPIGVGASLALGRIAFTTATTIASYGWLVTLVNIIAGYAVSWLIILVLYKVIPETHVRWKSALLGSAVAALLWELGKAGFGFYVQKSIGNSFYGSMVILPLFMMWIYLTWTFILAGLQLAYTHQYWPMLKRRYFFMRKSPIPITDLNWSLALAILLYQRFRKGESLTNHEAAEQLMIPNEICEQLLCGLEQAHLVNITKDHTYALARPPEEITAYDILTAVRALCDVPKEIAATSANGTGHLLTSTPALKQRDELETNWARNTTLVALAGNA